MKLCLPLESFRGSQAPCRAVCGTCGCFQKMHGGVSAPSFCAFPHRVAFKEVSGQWVHFKSGPGNRGRLACGTTHVAHLVFPRETSIILRCAGKARNTFHTKQGIDSPVAIRRRDGAQMKWCRDPRATLTRKPLMWSEEGTGQNRGVLCRDLRGCSGVSTKPILMSKISQTECESL